MPAAEVRVLGPVEVVGGDGAVVSLAAKQTRLLAALLVADGRTCGRDELVEAVWNGPAPASARNLLQVYVSQLRKALPPGITLVTRGDGYAVELASGCLDAARFERLLGECKAARAEGNPALAASLAERALALWRGRAYGELAYEDFARAGSERLEELRLVAREERLDALLALGRHAEALGEVLALADEAPERERAHELAMLALYRSGRQTEALEHYAAVRARLRDELGLEPGSELRELQRRILQQDPGLDVTPTIDDAVTDLPAAPNPLLGRDRELAELRERLLRDDVRLLVLTGAGGSGKTRLALEAAHRNAASFANGAAFVDLALVRDPGLLLAAIVRALPIEDADEEPLQALTAFLRTRELLVALDNAEHLHEATPVFSELLARAPRLTLLVTSRTVLHLSGEHVYPVQPLDEDAAVELFCARARQADPYFDPDAADEEAIRRICARLDGLPLAIELAAARTTSLRPTKLLERLDPSLPLLTGGPRDLPARQQTLQATLEWSFGLLTAEEHAVAARLGVFVGGFDLEAATAVCDADPDTLAALVDDHLLGRDDVDDEPRFRMLETVREYAASRLRDLEEPGDLHRRHAEYFLARVEAAERTLHRDGHASWTKELERLDREYGNVQAALNWTRRHSTAEEQLRVGRWAWRLWWVRGELTEGLAWLDAALEHSAGVDPGLRAHAILGAASLAWARGDLVRATDLAGEARGLFVELGDRLGEQSSLNVLGLAAHGRGEHDAASDYFEQSRDLAEMLGRDVDVAIFTSNLASATLDGGEPERAAELYKTALMLCRRLSYPIGIAQNELYLGLVELDTGCSAIAADRFVRSFDVYRQTGFRQYTAQCVEAIALAVHTRGESETAARLLGAADRLGRSFAPLPPGAGARRRDRFLAAMRADLGEARFEAARSEGEALTDEETYELVERALPG